MTRPRSASTSQVGCSAAAITSATSVNSVSPKPRVASAGVPIRSPEVTIGGRGSNGTALRLTVIPTSCSRSSACLPSRPDSRRSTSTRCTSVPPVSTATPASVQSRADSRSASSRAPRSVRSCRSANSGEAAIRNAAALAAITCISGPPCCPGNTAESTFLARSAPHRSRPPRGPAMVLCVVEVVICACGTGLGCRPAATRPAKCAMSTSSAAPTSSAIERKAPKSSWRGYADQPAMISCGRCSSAFSRTTSMSTR